MPQLIWIGKQMLGGTVVAIGKETISIETPGGIVKYVLEDVEKKV